MPEKPQELARRLADQAEAVCRHYLPAGRRQGNYWQIGDVHNTPGRSMFVRLKNTPAGPAGKWTDAATGEHGDLLDIVREACGLTTFSDVTAEARRFLRLPHPEPALPVAGSVGSRPSSGSPASARRLFAASWPIKGTLAEAYLCHRGITDLFATEALRFHPRCYYRPDTASPVEIWPAMIAAVTDISGEITGVHRTWLARDGADKALIATPRKAMGHLLGGGVRFGVAGAVLAAGEGIETVLSVRLAVPQMPVLAALSAAHLAAITFPTPLRRLYVLRDRDPAGDAAWNALTERACAVGIKAVGVLPRYGDFNEDLRQSGLDAIRTVLQDQLSPEDVSRFVVRRDTRSGRARWGSMSSSPRFLGNPAEEVAPTAF